MNLRTRAVLALSPALLTGLAIAAAPSASAADHVYDSGSNNGYSASAYFNDTNCPPHTTQGCWTPAGGDWGASVGTISVNVGAGHSLDGYPQTYIREDSWGDGTDSCGPNIPLHWTETSRDSGVFTANPDMVHARRIVVYVNGTGRATQGRIGLSPYVGEAAANASCG